MALLECPFNERWDINAGRGGAVTVESDEVMLGLSSSAIGNYVVCSYRNNNHYINNLTTKEKQICQIEN